MHCDYFPFDGAKSIIIARAILFFPTQNINISRTIYEFAASLLPIQQLE